MKAQEPLLVIWLLSTFKTSPFPPYINHSKCIYHNILSNFATNLVHHLALLQVSALVQTRKLNRELQPYSLKLNLGIHELLLYNVADAVKITFNMQTS